MMKPTEVKGAHKFRAAGSGDLLDSVQLVPGGTRCRLFSVSCLQDRTPTMSVATSTLLYLRDGDDDTYPVNVVVLVNNYNSTGITSVFIPANGIVFKNGIRASFVVWENPTVASGVQGISITYQ